jgi:hypothetical protein
VNGAGREDATMMTCSLKLRLLVLICFLGSGCAYAADAYAADPSGQPFEQGSSLPQSLDNAPAIVMSEVEFNFGEVAEESVISHDFPVKNAGRTVLNIDRVSPG